MSELNSMPRSANRDIIRAKIANKSLQNIDIFTFELTDSTNTRAKEFARERAARTPAVFIADEQSAGRGRMGRDFVSKRGAGLFITLLIYPEADFKDAVKLTAYAAVKACEAIRKTSGLSPKIKWVNDLYAEEKKLAGILAEGEILQDGSFGFALVGIGINIRDISLGEELDKITTNIEKECAKLIDKNELAAALIDAFFTPDENFMDKYRQNSLVVGEKVLVKRISGEEFYATATDITDSGALVVEYDGRREELISAEVSVRKITEE